MGFYCTLILDHQSSKPRVLLYYTPDPILVAKALLILDPPEL